MIYIVTNKPFTPYSFDVEEASVEDVLLYFEDKSELGVDTETTGFDPYTCELLTLQLGDESNQFIIDPSTVDLSPFKTLLESKTIILHNAKFDLRFLYHKGIRPYKNVFDTYLAERIISLGDKFHRKSLAACVNRYLKVTLNKDVRGLIHKLGIFNPTVIKYSADDVKYLIELKANQISKLKQADLMTVMSLENQFVSVLAYIEYCGVYLDKNKWIDKSNKDIDLLNSKIDILNKFMVEEFKNPKYIEPPNLFDNSYTCKINWNSPTQLVPFFEELGLNITVFEKGKVKKSINSKVLKPQKNVHPVVPIFLEFQKVKKLVTTYGLDFLKMVNPVTNRLHANFNQIMNTGRLSSGKSEENDEESSDALNLQNIPGGIERTCFIPQTGNKLVIADYSGQETRVLAEFSNDEEFSKYISDPSKDLHSFMASLIFPELKAFTHDEIIDKYPDKRKFAKAATFSIKIYS